MSTERPLGPLHVAAVVIGATVGVGIFFTPIRLAGALPSPLWILGVWLVGGIMTAASALVFAELGARYPHAGGLYVFLREGFGPRAGPFLAFNYGFQQLTVVQPGSMAAVALVLADNIGYLSGPLSPGLHTGLALAAIVMFTAANLIGLRVGGRIQVGMAALKIGALSLLIAVGIGWGTSARLFEPRATPVEGGLRSWIVLGLIPVLFSFGGAYHGTFIAGSVREPTRSVPRGIFLGVAAVLIGYLGANVAYLGLLGQSGLAASKSPAADAIGVAFGGVAGKAVAFIIVLSAAGLLNTICLGFPFVVYAMARDGVFIKQAGELNARTGRPTLAVAFQGAFACVALLLTTQTSPKVSEQIGNLLLGIAFAECLFQGAIAVVHLRVRHLPRGPDVIAAPAVAAWIFLVIELGLAAATLKDKPEASSFGVGALVLGSIIFVLWRRDLWRRDR